MLEAYKNVSNLVKLNFILIIFVSILFLVASGVTALNVAIVILLLTQASYSATCEAYTLMLEKLLILSQETKD